MPKPTFENLPEEKRQAIIAIAIEEFATHPYGVASVSRIVERAGIAKGSLYQYFAHKQDLFLYLVEYAAAHQMEILRSYAPIEQSGDIFSLLRRQMSLSAHIAAAAPLHARLVVRAFSDHLPFRDEVLRRFGAVGEDHFVHLIRRGIEAGEIAPEIDPDLAAQMIRSLMNDLGRLIANRMGLSDAEVLADPARLTGPEAEHIYDQVVAILRNGMGKR